jgi:hypothetical protein
MPVLAVMQWLGVYCWESCLCTAAAQYLSARPAGPLAPVFVRVFIQVPVQVPLVKPSTSPALVPVQFYTRKFINTLTRHEARTP